MAALGIFFRIVIKKIKLIKILIKKNLNILKSPTKKKKKKKTQIHSIKISFISFYILKSLYDMIVSLSMLLATSISMYTINQLLNY